MPDPVTIDPAEVSAALKEVRSQMFTQAGRLAEMAELSPEKRSANWSDEIRGARETVTLLDARMTALQRSLPEPEPVQGQGPQAGTRMIGSPSNETRSLGRQFIESDGYRQWAGDPSTRGSRLPQGSVEVRTLLTSALTDTAYTGAGAFQSIMPYVIAPQAVRRDRLVVRDLLPSTTTTYEVIHFIGETYVSGSDAGMVAEGALKPEVAMNWYRQDTNVKKIAGFVPATMEALTDYGQLRGAIDNRLQYKLARTEETQLLQGDGTGQNLLGLLNAPNLQSSPFTTNAFTSISLGRAQIENHDGDANGMIMHPTDYWASMAASASTLTGASPFNGPPGTIWGIPVVRTPRMTIGRALVGDFQQGAEIFDREDVTIRVGDQHNDFFIRNQVAILAEKRETLVIYRGDLFSNVAVA